MVSAKKYSRTVLISDIKLLYSRSAGRCNICGEEVFKEKESGNGFVHIGEMAHNTSFSSNIKAPRWIDQKSGDNSYNNLILLCANHHRIVDGDETTYTVEKIYDLKKSFEKKVKGLWKEISPTKATILSIDHLINLTALFKQLQFPYKSIQVDALNKLSLLTEQADAIFLADLDQDYATKIRELCIAFTKFSKIVGSYYKEITDSKGICYFQIESSWRLPLEIRSNIESYGDDLYNKLESIALFHREILI